MQTTEQKDFSLAISKVGFDTIQTLQTNDRLFSKFINKNAGFIHNIVKKFNAPDVNDYEDYYSIGMLSLYKSLFKFDPERGKSLSTFAHHCIYNDILQHVNKENKKREKEVSIEKFVRKFDNGNIAEYNEALFKIPNVEKTLSFEEQMMNQITVEEFYSKLEQLHKDIFYYRVVLQFKHEEIATKLGLNIHTYKHIWHYHVSPKIKGLKKEIKSKD